MSEEDETDTSRERMVIAAFVSMTNRLVDEFDVVDLLDGLAGNCARMLDIASAGVLLADRHGVLHVIAASSGATRDLELFQLQRDQGPCVDSFRDGLPVSVADLGSERERWPDFVDAAASAGFASVHAVPMRLREHRLGTLGLFGARPGALSDEDIHLAQALAHVGSVAIVHADAVADASAVTDQLQRALDSRVVIEQAKGLLAQLGDLAMEQAFQALRSYARDRNQRLTELAAQLVSRSIQAQVVLDHARARGVLHEEGARRAD